MSIQSTLSFLLDTLMEQLAHANLYSEQPPTTAQLASSEPFAVDTMRFEQWLQFVFVPKLRQMIEESQALPKAIAILPMAEQTFFARNIDAPMVLSTLAKIDALLSGQHA